MRFDEHVSAFLNLISFMYYFVALLIYIVNSYIEIRFLIKNHLWHWHITVSSLRFCSKVLLPRYLSFYQ